MLKTWIRRELELKNLGLTHKQPSLFTSSQWPCHGGLYLLWRVITAGYLLVWVVLSGVWDYGWHTTESNRIKWFIYLTNWAFSILAVSAIWRATVVAAQYCRNMTHQEYKKEPVMAEMTWYLKASWVLYNLSTTSALVVSFAYWVFIYKDEIPLHPVDFVTHATNAIYVLVDLYITATPVRLWHFVHGMLFSVLYMLFCLLYTLAGGTNALDKEFIYTTFDWRGSPGLASFYGVLLTIVGPLAVWLVVYLAYALRLAVNQTCCSLGDSPEGSECSEETDLDNVQDGYIPHVSSTQKMIDC